MPIRAEGATKQVRHSSAGTLFGMGLLVAAGLLQTAQADKTFTGSGNWSDGTLWTGGTKPVDGDVVIIDGNATNDEATAILASYTLNANRTNTFLGTNYWLRATNVVVNGIITHPVNTDTNAPWSASNIVYIIAYSNLTLNAGGQINVDGKGYRGRGGEGDASYGYAYGPGAGGSSGNDGWGGGHGGRGEGCFGGATYGSANAPVEPGSGGNGCNGITQPGGNGGGVVRIEAGGTVQVDGTITANGANVGVCYGAGGGSGGSVYITCSTLKGGGTVRAAGGNGYNWGASSGGGGGGRIAVIYSTAENVTITFSLRKGTSYPCAVFNPALAWQVPGEVGTLYLSDTNFLPSTLVGNYFRLQVSGFTTWTPSSLTVTGAWVRLQDELAVNVAGDLVVGTNGVLAFGEHTALNVGGNLTVTNGGKLYVYSGVTNASWTNSGSVVTVQGAIQVASNSVIYAAAHPTGTGTPVFVAGSVNVAPGGAISADGLGYATRAGGYTYGYGPGGGYSGNGNYGSGAGHGGRGGDAQAAGACPGGGTYGSGNAPITAGSGGGQPSSAKPTLGWGSGAVRIQTLNYGGVTVNGAITANSIVGTNYYAGNNGRYASVLGGGAGGSVFIQCGKLAGSGLISANGAVGLTASSGGGGGGRIAIWRQRDQWTGTSFDTNVVVAGGAGGYAAGTNGTIYLLDLPILRGTVITLQ